MMPGQRSNASSSGGGNGWWLARPRLRQDLVAEPIEEGGHRYIDMIDPDTGRSFRFFEVEYSLACAMDGQRDIANLAQWAAEELGVWPTDQEVTAVISTLGELGYLAADAGASASQAASAPSAGAEDDFGSVSAEVGIGPGRAARAATPVSAQAFDDGADFESDTSTAIGDGTGLVSTEGRIESLAPPLTSSLPANPVARTRTDTPAPRYDTGQPGAGSRDIFAGDNDFGFAPGVHAAPPSSAPVDEFELGHHTPSRVPSQAPVAVAADAFELGTPGGSPQQAAAASPAESYEFALGAPGWSATPEPATATARPQADQPWAEPTQVPGHSQATPVSPMAGIADAAVTDDNYPTESLSQEPSFQTLQGQAPLGPSPYGYGEPATAAEPVLPRHAGGPNTAVGGHGMGAAGGRDIFADLPPVPAKQPVREVSFDAATVRPNYVDYSQADAPTMLGAQAPVGYGATSPLSDDLTVSATDVQAAVRASQAMQAVELDDDMTLAVDADAHSNYAARATEPMDASPSAATAAPPPRGNPGLAELAQMARPAAVAFPPVPQPAYAEPYGAQGGGELEFDDLAVDGSEPAVPPTLRNHELPRARTARRGGLKRFLLGTLVVILVAGLGAGAFLTYYYLIAKPKQASQEAAPVPAAAPQPSPATDKPLLTATLRTASARPQAIASPRDGTVTFVVEAGISVKQGDALAKFEGVSNLERKLGTGAEGLIYDIEKRYPAAIQQLKAEKSAAEADGDGPLAKRIESKLAERQQRLAEKTKERDELLTELASFLVKAPADGKVERAVAKGSTLKTGDELVALTLLSGHSHELELPAGADPASFGVGKTLRLAAKADPAKQYACEVSAVQEMLLQLKCGSDVPAAGVEISLP